MAILVPSLMLPSILVLSNTNKRIHMLSTETLLDHMDKERLTVASNTSYCM
jgi:hypothetical protein